MTKNKIEIFKVGGCIRDSLMYKIPSDIDYVVVGATSEYMIENGYKNVGNSFPVFLDSNGDEYALARTERKNGRGYTGFDVDFSPTITLKDDLERRDLTINAMAVNADVNIKSLALYNNKIIDYFGGKKDLKKKVLRHVSDAFKEDPVRVLRIARFNARFGDEWTVADETYKLLVEMESDGLLDELVAERVWKEMEKALDKALNPVKFFEVLNKANCLMTIFPEFSKIDLEKLELSSHNGYINFGMLMSHMMKQDDSFDVDSFCNRLKVPNEYSKFVMLIYNIETMIETFHNLSPSSIVEKTYWIVDKLKKMNISHITSFLLLEFAEMPFNIFKMLLISFNEINTITFDSLPQKFKDNLKGKEIGEKLTELKKDKIHLIYNDVILNNSQLS
jgi:tRNA nucleotidyltransferase (CCA-adding enzyme)